jgi:hypothetical protein
MMTYSMNRTQHWSCLIGCWSTNRESLRLFCAAHSPSLELKTVDEDTIRIDALKMCIAVVLDL